MTTKRRTDYQVDEEALETHDGRRCDRFGKNGSSGRGAGNKSQAGPCPEKQEKKSGSSRQQIKKTPDGAVFR
ncbi:hypothetical protein NXW50_05185 [Bacteroides thetaiotaomicron]|nr:hypothetical protein [Bacteroides thetaiotaomicron]